MSGSTKEIVDIESVAIPGEIGVLPLRNSVLFPHAIMPISVGRRKTLNLLDDVVREGKVIGVVSQRNPADDDPDPHAASLGALVHDLVGHRHRYQRLYHHLRAQGLIV